MVYLIYNDKTITRTIAGAKETFTVTNTKVNEWGTTVYYTTDGEGYVCIWKFGKSNYGDPFAQFENRKSTITYNDSFTR